MAKRTASGYYRRSHYKKRRWRTVLVASAVVIAILLAVLLVMGNILNNKTASDQPENTQKPVHTHQTTKPPYQLAQPSYTVSIKGKALSLDTEDPKDVAASLKEEGYTAVSLNLSDKDGKLLFKSSVADRFGYPSASPTVDLSSFNDKLSSSIRTSAVLSLNSLSEDDPITRSVLKACEAAIVCEIAAAGIDDILLRCPDITEENIDEIISIADQVNSVSPDAVIGLVLTSDILGGENASPIVERIISSFDFVAMDLSDTFDEEAPAKKIEERISTGNYYYILRYNMRLLLPELADEKEAAEVYALMDSNNITNWQTLS